MTAREIVQGVLRGGEGAIEHVVFQGQHPAALTQRDVERAGPSGIAVGKCLHGIPQGGLRQTVSRASRPNGFISARMLAFLVLLTFGVVAMAMVLDALADVTEQHRCRVTRAMGRIEAAERGQAEAGGQGDDVAHGGDCDRNAGRGA